MKQLTKFGMLFGAIGLLASCSSDNIDGPNPDNGGLLNDGKMYAALNITMPAGSGTRAESGDLYEDGETDGNEYAVKNVYLYVFSGSSGVTEGNATFLVKGEVTEGTSSTDDNKDITTAYKDAVVELPGFDVASGTDYYGLVVINAGSDTEWVDPLLNEKFSDWMDRVGALTTINMTPSISNTKYFTMSNAPQYKAADSKVETLVKLTNSNFEYTVEEAKKKTADKIYVQRGVAKVRVTLNAEYTLGETNHKVKLTGWSLDNTNTKTYPVQNVTSDITTLLSTKGHMHGGIGFLDHVWWGVDPNYTGTSNAYNSNNANDMNTFSAYTTYTTVSSGNANTNFDYCLENTFDINNMTQDQTTRVVFEGTLYLDGATTAADFVEYAGRIAGLSGIELAENVVSGTKKLSELGKDEENWKKIAAALGMTADGNVEVNYHQDGKVYYAARIRHFSDEDDATNMPLKDTQIQNGKYVYEEGQLGRYGVLRNNVYDLTVNSITAVGDPTTPPDPNTPDDEIKEKNKINVEINILAWRKRTQQVDF